MWGYISMNIGIIGDGKHSKRIQKILKKKYKFFIYNPKRPSYIDNNKLKFLQKCNIIFILSPNQSHFYYINLLKKNRYIFCEKPPVGSLKELETLKKKRNNEKIFFNFNKRYSYFSKIIQDRKKYKLGQFIYGSLITSHGLAQTKGYLTNWRSDISTCKKGVFEMVSIHDIDLFNYIFGLKKINFINLTNTSRKGNSYDTSTTQITLKNNAQINIFSTYNSSFNDTALLMFENGIIEKTNNAIIIYGPTKNFNKRGFFIKPKVINKINISAIQDYNESLEKSVNYFFDHVIKKKKFAQKDLNCSLETNRIILS